MENLSIINVDLDKQTVSARELHQAVGSTERFSTWFERQLQFGFEENVDYSNPLKVLRVQQEGERMVQREVEDYELTIDMAKQIAMVQKNEKARMVRQYLIDLEKAWNTPEQVMARALRLADATIDGLKGKIAEMQPKVLFADAVSASHTSILIGDLAKLICQNGVKTGQKRLFEFMRNNGYLIKGGSSRNMPTQRYLEQGLFEIKETNIQNPDGSIRITRTPKVTGKGQIYFVNLFIKELATV